MPANQVSVDQTVKKSGADSAAGRNKMGRNRSSGGLLPDPSPNRSAFAPKVCQPLYTPEGSVVQATLTPPNSRHGMVSPILSYGQLPVLAPPSPYPGYFVETPTVQVRSDEPRLESKDDFPDISTAVPSKRKSFGKFPKKRPQK